MRIKIIRLIIIILFAMIAMELVYIQAIRGQYFYRLSKNNRIRVVPLEGSRGRIKDVNGVFMADNRMAYNVVITPHDLKETDKVFRFLSEVLDTDLKTIAKRYQRDRTAPFAPVIIAEDINRRTAITIEENTYRFPSLSIQESFKRYYPLEDNSAHILGYVGKRNRTESGSFKEYGYSPQSMVGYTGIEEYYDSFLRGEVGGIQVEVNSRGQQVRLLSFKEPKKGVDLILTIDTRIQQKAQELLAARRGVAIVMDMDNGEILGLVSSPGFNPNVFMNSEDRKKISSLFYDTASPLLNRAIKGLFPPGSVFKAILATAGLNNQTISTNTTFMCNGVYQLGGMEFRCTHTHGAQNIFEAIAHSCNIYFYHLGLKLGVDTIEEYAQLFNLGHKTNIDLPYEEAGSIPSRQGRLANQKRKWYTGETLNLSIGQGDVLTTPLQLVRMMATIASDGLEVQPHVIKAMGDNFTNQFSGKRQIDIRRDVFKKVKEGLRQTVTDPTGTAADLNISNLYVAGKTGTAQSSGNQENHAWFVGYVKGEHRNVSFCVFLEHGGSSHNAVLLSRELLVYMQSEEIL